MAGSISEMSLEWFEELLNKYGPEVEEWPEMYQADAKSFLTNSEEARAFLQIERNVGKLISSQDVPKAPPSLVDKILAKAKKS